MIKSIIGWFHQTTKRLIMMLNYQLIETVYKRIVLFIVLLQLKSTIKNHQCKCHYVGDTKQRRLLANFDLFP